MKIGYSCWGFLGNGIKDTPDGGRSHRLTLLKELIRQGVEIVMLQKNRDLIEGNQSFSRKNLIFSGELPEIDALFVEYRWKIVGRNYKVRKNNPAYTPDFDRQSELINFYNNRNIPIIIWDKDQKLGKNEIKGIKNLIVFEPALKPRFNRKSLLFPMDNHRTKIVLKLIGKYKKNIKSSKLCYIGNQYERDGSFKEFINKPASMLDTKTPVFGNWNKYPEKYKQNMQKFSNVEFKGRVQFNKVNNIYKKSFSTVLIAPRRYYITGHFTQRLFEAMWGLCIPFTPQQYHGWQGLIIKDFIIRSGKDLINKIKKLETTPDSDIRRMFDRQFEKLNLFNASKQASIIINEINNHNGRLG
ncbi:MAG: hypothetical protein A2406_01640 [Candidatus Komeilibacteria bacterium RIFOXYC1_FULL_37_11]|uniref:Glycosyltransferase family 1 protein n=1 Tax=Candidatus Komeilibacteria bacterium RIFOXYC1_FULL_37_11 TaxID=1798555 RepID=A0A1G2BYG7_9BACT|nr:MAG: hypothetical protein A2406_01640 [Candidatus Komeilibacteria bacterium RIFOXYC1_FULL_37_11]OGY95326.1 MAG: hypothetical protein A2611_01345 [Candidatus Komeilibacteria bacterium RIFOXYD1_FULL_37_29]